MALPSLENAIDALTHQTQSLPWDDLPAKLLPNEEQAKLASNLVLIGQLVAKRPPNKSSLFETIRKVWDFAQELSLEDLKTNKFLFTFKRQSKKSFVLESATWNFKGHLMILK